MAKRALVLAGGGSRGAYQIGVWKALRELGITFDIVTGSSVGALNGALMVQGDFEAGLQLWENISPGDVMTDILSDEDLSTMKEPTIWRTFIHDALEQGGCDITPLENTLRRLLDEPRFRSSPIDYALVTVEYPSLKPQELTKEQIPEGMVCDYLLASSACFPAFKMKEINGSRFLDGGYHDNLPMNLAISMGAEEIIAVDLQSMGIACANSIPNSIAMGMKMLLNKGIQLTAVTVESFDEIDEALNEAMDNIEKISVKYHDDPVL
jgi:NTE family protein